MNINDFANQKRGKIVSDPWGGYIGQCVSLVKRWITANGWPMRSGNAIRWQYNGYGSYKWYKNYPWSVPQAGDIIVFQTGVYGHIGIVMPGASVWRVDVLNQNWPHGRCKDPVTVTRFNYLNPKCLGWLRKI